MKRLQCFVFFSMVFIFQLGCAIPFLDNQAVQNGIVPVLDTQGMKWQDDLCYLTYLCMDEFGQLSFRTYPFSSITMPGIYILAGNVLNQITISVSNVTLDMNGHTVGGGTNGIIINGGLSNITIKNGAIDAVSSDGIQINSGCSAIQICDVAITNAVRAVNVQQVEKSVIKNCDLDLSTTGLVLDECRSITVRNCRARANSHAGYDLLASTTCSLLGCQAISTGEGNNDIDSTTVFGFVCSNGNGNIFERCIANATQALSVTDSNSLIAGFALRGSESCTKIFDSESANTQTNVTGFTVPYGILLEGTLDSTMSVAGALGTDGQVWNVSWSPDGQYVAVGGTGLTGGTGDQFQIVSFDRIAETITPIAGALAGLVRSVSWSPGGKYLAVCGSGLTGGNELQIFSFDRSQGVLTSVAGALGTDGDGIDVSWSPDGLYIAVVGLSILGGTGNPFQIFSFDRIAEAITSVTGALGAGNIQSVSWSPDGQYIAVGGDGLTGGNELQIFSFDRAQGVLTSVTGALNGFILRVSWSSDGQYIAVGGDGLTSGTGDELQIFSFDRSQGVLTPVTGALGTAGEVRGVSWSCDGQYIAVGGAGLTGGTGDELQIFYFDRAQGVLTSVAGALGTDGQVLRVSWSPDGQYIAAGEAFLTGGNEFQILTGLQFPENNVIKGNTVFCNSGAQFPSGIGISGSTISNYIVGNTAWNNPIPRGANAPVVSSNYAYVTNVFNQLFGDAPTALQNISLSGIDPIWNRYDIPTKLLRLEALAESLIDNLL